MRVIGSLCKFDAMKLLSLLLLIVLLPVRSTAHPLHLSITNITLESGKLQITMKTFRDDWEVAYFHYHSQVIDLTDLNEGNRSWMEKYLNSRFRISLDKGSDPFDLVVDNITQEEDALTVQMSCNLTMEPNSLYIYNALLTDIFPDQTNLLIFGYMNKESGIRFDVKKQDAEVMLN
jgi:hypothetical protein